MTTAPISLIKSAAPFMIVKGIPVPPRKGGTGAPPIYPFAQMEVGDSFDAPRDMGKRACGTCNRQGSVSNSGISYAKRNNPTAKFSVRIIDENTVRCWRLA